MLLSDLPCCVLELIFENLTYDQLASLRLVCQKFNETSQTMLNAGFKKMVRRHGILLKAIKAQLPRRESERRNHPLAKHSDILTCLETRISMLSMTYTKYMEAGLCCFIPGKVIDEVLNVLNTISTKQMTSDGVCKFVDRPLRTHEILQELRDISSMAIEHFEEKVAPSFRDLPLRFGAHPSTSLPTYLTSLRTVEKKPDAQCPQITVLCERLEKRYKQMMQKLTVIAKVVNRHTTKISDFSKQINELNCQIVDLRRRLEESNNSKKSVEQMASVAGTSVDNDESHATAVSSCSKNIKPRAATIILKRVAETPTESSVAKKQKNNQNENKEFE